jgi:hypothetical protein
MPSGGPTAQRPALTPRSETVTFTWRRAPCRRAAHHKFDVWPQWRRFHGQAARGHRQAAAGGRVVLRASLVSGGTRAPQHRRTQDRRPAWHARVSCSLPRRRLPARLPWGQRPAALPGPPSTRLRQCSERDDAGWAPAPAFAWVENRHERRRKRCRGANAGSASAPPAIQKRAPPNIQKRGRFIGMPTRRGNSSGHCRCSTNER